MQPKFLADLALIPQHLPDWRHARFERNNAIGATTNWIDGVSISTWRTGGSGPRPKWIDLTIAFIRDGAIANHTMRFWRKGAISLLDCDGGGISGQDTMHLFGVGHGCEACMKVVNAWRYGRGSHRALEYLHGDYNKTRAFMDEVRRMQGGKGAGGVREDRDHARETRAHAVGLIGQPLPMRLESLTRVVFDRMWRHDRAMNDWKGVVHLGPHMAMSASCDKRGWGRADKRLTITVTYRWLANALAGRMFLHGCQRIIGGIVGYEKDGTMVAWAFKEGAPKGDSNWWKARFKPYRMHDGDMGWEFFGWVRNGGMPVRGVK